MAPHQQWLSQTMVREEEQIRTWMKEKSAKVPALKGLLDRPFDLGCVELMERAMRDKFFLGNAFRSLKRHGSSPHRVLDLLCFLGESSDGKMQKIDLDDMTMEHLTAGRRALREAIGDVELAWIPWKPHQVDAPWFWYWRPNAWYLGSQALPELRAMDARASMLMTRLKDEAKKENARCLQEANVKTKQDELHMQVQQLPQDCERLKEEVSQRHAITLQLQQLQLECKDLRKKQEENESERLKEEESQRQGHELQKQQLQLECENWRKRHEENESERLKEEETKRQEHALQLQQLQLECEHLRKKQEESECERLKERQAVALQMQELKLECEHLRKKQEEYECERLKEESQRQALTLQLQALQLQQLQLENETLKKNEFKFKSLVATAQSLKSKVEQFCNECEKCDAEDVSQPDSSWELCTLMTEASGISIDTTGHCFMREAVFKAAPPGGFVSGQDLRKGSKILAADGSTVEVADLPEVLEKRGKVVLHTEKAKLEVTADHRVVNVTHDGAQRKVPAFKLSVGDLVMVDNQTESLTHVDFDPATFEVLKIGFSPDKPVEAFSVLPTMQSYGHKMATRHRGGRRARRGRENDHLSIPDTEGYLTD